MACAHALRGLRLDPPGGESARARQVQHRCISRCMEEESREAKTGGREDEVVIIRVSPPLPPGYPPPPKKSKVLKEERELIGVDDEEEEPLRCSTPKPAACEELSGSDLDATLESLGISHDSIG